METILQIIRGIIVLSLVVLAAKGLDRTNENNKEKLAFSNGLTIGLFVAFLIVSLIIAIFSD